MSRSGKKNPFFGNCAYSDKKGKQQANRKIRRKNRLEILRESESFSSLREVSDIWDFPKDGKHFNESMRIIKSKSMNLRFYSLKLYSKDRKY